MRYLILFMFLVGIFVLGSRSCGEFSFFGFGGVRGEGPLRTETRDVRDFHAVDVGLPGAVEVSVADHFSVEIQAQENLVPFLKTEVKDGELQLYFDRSVSDAKDLKVRITAPAYDALALSGSATMRVLTPLQGDKLDLSIGGSGSIDLPQADVHNLKCSIAGSGDIRVSGKAQAVEYSIAGSGDITAKALQADTGKAAISGSGTVTCNVTQTLKAEIAGSGDIYYTGSPSVDTDIAGSGKVKRAE